MKGCYYVGEDDIARLRAENDGVEVVWDGFVQYLVTPCEYEARTRYPTTPPITEWNSE